MELDADKEALVDVQYGHRIELKPPKRNRRLSARSNMLLFGENKFKLRSLFLICSLCPSTSMMILPLSRTLLCLKVGISFASVALVTEFA